MKKIGNISEKFMKFQIIKVEIKYLDIRYKPRRNLGHGIIGSLKRSADESKRFFANKGGGIIIITFGSSTA